VLSMMDRLWRPDLTEEEAVQLMEKGIDEVIMTYLRLSHWAWEFQSTSSWARNRPLSWLNAMKGAWHSICSASNSSYF
jgi:hypothetical protein